MTSANGGLTIKSLPDQYNNAIDSVRAMGFIAPAPELPSLERLEDSLGWHDDWLREQEDAGQGGTLVIFPSLQILGLRGSPTHPGLIPRFGRVRGAYDRTTVDEEVWGQFRDKDPAHDGRAGARFEWGAAVLLNDRRDPRRSGRKANDLDEPGLMYTDRPVDEQLAELELEQDRHAKEGRHLTAATLPVIVMAKLIQRNTGTERFSRGVMNLVHYEPIALQTDGQGGLDADAMQIPTVVFAGKRMRLGYESVGNASRIHGVRRKIDLTVMT